MPLYEFKCEECGHEFEELVGRGAEASQVGCPRCRNEKVTRLQSTFAKIGTGRGSSQSSSSCGEGGSRFT